MIEQFLKKGFIHIKNTKPLSTNELKNIALKFGNIYIYPENANYKFIKDKSVATVSKKGMFEDSRLEWHKDMIHTIPWYAGTLLYCKKPSDEPTNFCYTLKSSLNDKKYRHGCFSGATGIGNDVYNNEAKIMDRLAKNPKLRERAKHLFTTHLLDERATKFNYYIDHPVTKEKCITASPATMIIKSDERTSIINDLLNNNEQFSHNWNKYDVIIIDNYKLMHSRKSSPKNRKLVRINFNYDNIL